MLGIMATIDLFDLAALLPWMEITVPPRTSRSWAGRWPS